ncbi:MAG: class I SAM-dependent methyltransferase [Thermodesulfovibrionales bacterium]|nr:class I SAM-dependent methyltransferase [Thermodesulfovibrionales bacterium]
MDAYRVKEANKAFYDKVGSNYEQFDGRRSDDLAKYVRDNIKHSMTERLLDLGCGSAFVARNALDMYKSVVGLDISFKILADTNRYSVMLVNADIDSLPFKDESFDCVVTFATLHHCYEFQSLFKEIYRVLKKGGLYYSDHDMNNIFYKRFAPLVKLYRILFSSLKRYKKSCPEITDAEYHLSEFHSNGIPTETIKSLLIEAGFSEITIKSHWFGLSSLFDSIFGNRLMPLHLAPLVKIKAIK